MGQPMPATTQCSQCMRTFPVRAQMQVEGKSLPMLVVLPEVISVDEALEQATCQVCLKKTGLPDRGLYEILKRLGLKDEEDDAPSPREVTVIRVREGHTTPTVGVVVSDSRPREVTIFDPLMGTSIQVTHQEPPAHERRSRDPRRDDWRASPSEPRLPSVLRERKRDIKPEPKVEHLTGTLADSAANAAALETAMKAAKERDEAKRRVRLAKFGGFMGSVARLLARIREAAALTDVQDEVAEFRAKLSKAAGVDPKSRGKKRLTEHLGTSQGELERLCYFFYEPRERRHILNPEIIDVDAFEGDRRPEFWDQNGGMRADFYVVQVEIVRTKSTMPIFNPPRSGGDDDSRPRIVYPEGHEYGPDYRVENPTREPHQFAWERNALSWATVDLVCWLGDHQEAEILCNGIRFPLDDLMCWIVELAVMSDEELETDDSNTDPAIKLTPAMPERPATT